jgi:hypothetical protein
MKYATRTSLFLNRRHMEQLDKIGKVEGLTASTLVRISISEYLKRAARSAPKAAKSSSGLQKIEVPF